MTGDKLTRASVLASELHEFLGWHILYHCPGCGSSSDKTVNCLAKRYGVDVEVYTVTRKLRCAKCDVEPDEVPFVPLRANLP